MIVRELNRLLAEKMDGIKYEPVSIHGEIVDPKDAAAFEPVITDKVALFGSETMKEVIRQLYKFPEEYKEKDAQRSFLSANR